MFPPTTQGYDKPKSIVTCKLTFLGCRFQNTYIFFYFSYLGNQSVFKKISQSDSLKIPVCNHYICPKSPLPCLL